MTSEPRPFEILVAEDNPADVRLVQEALKHHAVDCALHVVYDGAQAIEFINRLEGDRKHLPLDLLLVDMHLPKRDGEEILKHLRSTERYAQIPVVVMTGADSAVVEGKATKHAAPSGSMPFWSWDQSFGAFGFRREMGRTASSEYTIACEV